MQKRRARFLLRLNVQAHQRLKNLAKRKNTTITNLLIEAVNDLLVKHGLRPVAKASPPAGRPKGK